MGHRSFESEREAAVKAARLAADVLAGFRGQLHVQNKGRNDLVTQADVASQKTIRDYMARHFPGDDFLGEEEAQDPTSLTKSRRWIVDPIDGTTNFVHGFPFYCISIALECDGELVVGVIYDPEKRECFSASIGQGAKCDNTPFTVSSSAKLSESLVCVGLPAEPDKYPHSLASLARFASTTRAMRRMGSAALCMAYVASGRADAFLAHIIHPWDVAAGVLLVREAGGCVTNLATQQYNLYTSDILASNGLIHAELQRELTSNP